MKTTRGWQQTVERERTGYFIIPPRSTQSIQLLRIGKGNKIASYGAGPTKVYGIKNTATSITQIPAGVMSGTNPDTGGANWEAYTDGLCFGYLNDDASGTAVFIANKATPSGGVATQDVLTISALEEGARVYARRFVLVPKSTDPTVLIPVYLIWRA